MEFYHSAHICQIHHVICYQLTTFSSIFNVILQYIQITIYLYMWQYTTATFPRILIQKQLCKPKIDFFFCLKAAKINPFSPFGGKIDFPPQV